MNDPFVNEHEIRIIGMSRSGNHAVIQWLIAQVQAAGGGRRVCWLNCVEGKYNPYWTARPFDNGEPYWVNYRHFDLEAEKQRRWSRKDCFLFNHEDCYLRNACSEVYENSHDEWVGPSAKRYDVLILRDPFNLFASRLRSLQHSVSPAIAVKIWKQHAKQVLGRISLLRHRPVIVSYNQWCDDQDYRRNLARQLEVPFSDTGINRVAAVHGGSSFDGLAYDGRADQMRIHERWRHYIDDDTYCQLFDDELLGLAEAIFGRLPAMDVLVARPATASAA